MRAIALLFCLLQGAAVLPADAAEPAQAFSTVRERPPAPVLRLQDTEGTRYRLADMRGKVVLVNFWATWCPPCREEMPSLERLWQKLQGEPFLVLAVSVGESGHLVQIFAEQLPLRPTFPLLLDSDRVAAKEWSVVGMPTTYLVSKDGRVAFGAAGAVDFASPEVLRQIRSLLSAR